MSDASSGKHQPFEYDPLAPKWEREFLKLAGQFLCCRLYLLDSTKLDLPGKYNDMGTYCGMIDAACEMKLICQEELSLHKISSQSV